MGLHLASAQARDQCHCVVVLVRFVGVFDEFHQAIEVDAFKHIGRNPRHQDSEAVVHIVLFVTSLGCGTERVLVVEHETV